MKDKVYVVTMYRWGDRECHSYVLGVYNKKLKAIDAGIDEAHSRGGKYAPECIEFEHTGNNFIKSGIVIPLEGMYT